MNFAICCKFIVVKIEFISDNVACWYVQLIIHVKLKTNFKNRPKLTILVFKNGIVIFFVFLGFWKPFLFFFFLLHRLCSLCLILLWYEMLDLMQHCMEGTVYLCILLDSSPTMWILELTVVTIYMYADKRKNQQKQ